MLAIAGLALAASMVVGQAESPESLVYPHLKVLECFIGKWEGKATIPPGTIPSESLGDRVGKEVVFTLDVQWAPGKSAQIVTTEYRLEDIAVIRSAGVTGWDERSQKIREHWFTTHKGVWSGTWTKDRDTLVFEIEGTNLDGKKCTGTSLVTFKDNDHFVQKDVKLTVDGKPQPDWEWKFVKK